jgi:hypothetical protein
MPKDSSKREIWWEDNPPEDGDGPRIRILVVPPNRNIDLVVIGHQLVGVNTHWINNTTKPCQGRRCPYAADGAHPPTRWKGYLAVYEPKKGGIWLLELSDGAVRHCEQLQDRTLDLRGSGIHVWRHGGKKNARMFAELRTSNFTGGLPAGFDERAALERHWFGPSGGRGSP